MAGEAQSRPKCGGRAHFDTRTIEGLPFNPAQPERSRCRAPFGLADGEKGPDSPCTRPAGTFQPGIRPSRLTPRS